jgi:hypothetical protein
MGRHRPPLTVGQILAWADAHHARTGEWPTAFSGPVADAPGEKWDYLDQALRNGHRGLPGGDSLPRLLDRRRRGGKKPRRPPGRPWTPAEDELVRTLSPREAARRTGRGLRSPMTLGLVMTAPSQWKKCRMAPAPGAAAGRGRGAHRPGQRHPAAR